MIFSIKYKPKIPNINFTANDFYRVFPDTIAINDNAQARPNMQGSRMVLDLRKAIGFKIAINSVARRADHTVATYSKGLRNRNRNVQRWGGCRVPKENKQLTRLEVVRDLVKGMTDAEVLQDLEITL